MTVIIAAWEAEIWRIMVPGQSGQKVFDNPSQPIAECSGAYLSSQAIWEADIGRITV
jgi:hypothetical protein